jgi:3-oxoacyl-[acyl-carrier-protein] synthase III
VTNYSKVLENAAAQAAINLSDIKYIFINQGSPKIIDSVEKNLLMPHDTIFRTFQQYVHAGNADVLIGLEANMANLKQGDIVALVMSGIGYSWSCSLLQYGN